MRREISTEVKKVKGSAFATAMILALCCMTGCAIGGVTSHGRDYTDKEFDIVGVSKEQVIKKERGVPLNSHQSIRSSSIYFSDEVRLDDNMMKSVNMYIADTMSAAGFITCYVFEYCPKDGTSGAVHMVFNNTNYVCVWFSRLTDPIILYECPLTDILLSNWETI